MGQDSLSAVNETTLDQSWIAYELHDGLLQWVVAARMHAAGAIAIAEGNEVISKLEHINCLSRIKSLLDMAAEEGRNLIRFLEETASRKIQIADLLSEFIERIRPQATSEPAAQVTLKLPCMPWPELQGSQAWSIFRILQQAIQNAITHSQASQIIIELGIHSNNEINGTVLDNGIGFDPSQAFSDHFGLRSMRHRASICGGKLEIQSSPGNGCKITFIAPIDPIDPKCVTSTESTRAHLPISKNEAKFLPKQ